MGKIAYLRYFLKSTPGVLGWKLFHKKKDISHFGKVKNISIESTNELLIKAFDSGEPFAAIRFGAVEIGALNNYEKIKLGLKKTYKRLVRYSMKNNAGFFPTTDDCLTRYAKLYWELGPNVDILGISGIHMEEYFHHFMMPQSKIGTYECFEPLIGSWLRCLQGKKVLVISPFDEEIKKQYPLRKELFSDSPDLIPDFELKVIKAPLTLAQETPDGSFFDELNRLTEEMKKTDFEILLVGAGAYGTFLAMEAKRLGKKAIQTGGATPTMFGIIGKRWENRPHVSKHINNYWIRPYNKPKGFKEVENGAYW